jgi:hypothetical protein
VAHARGSLERPRSDAELDTKFRGQASMVLPAAKVDRLAAFCKAMESSGDVAGDLGRALQD